MSELKVKGKIVKILEVEKGTSKAGKEWKKLNFVIDTDSNILEDLITNTYGLDFKGCNSDGQKKINELIEENIIVEFK